MRGSIQGARTKPEVVVLNPTEFASSFATE
jgi:hypothetical protein